MKNLFLLTIVFCFATNAFAQITSDNLNPDSVIVSSRVEFFLYSGAWGDKELVKKPAIRFILTVKNKGTKPIPDLEVTNRSKYVNLFINDSLNNPVSFYNGSQAMGDHLIKKNGSDTYTWWVFQDEGYGDVFVVQWQYHGLFSKKHKVNVTKKSIEKL